MKPQHRSFTRTARRLVDAWQTLAPVFLAGNWAYRPPAPWEMELHARLLQRRQSRSAGAPPQGDRASQPVGHMSCCAGAVGGV